jgi:stage V sporulation protein S
MLLQRLQCLDGKSVMNRFLSKLDLRDIKIDPRGSRFPPDAADFVPEDEPTTSYDSTEPVSEFTRTIAAEPELTDDVYADNDDTETEAILDVAPVEVEPEPIARAAAEGVRSGEVLKVSARSRPSAVAGAIAGVVRESGRAEVQAIGAGATNQAVKAVAIARDYLRETGIDAVCLPAFIDVTIDNEDRTAIRLVIEPR